MTLIIWQHVGSMYEHYQFEQFRKAFDKKATLTIRRENSIFTTDVKLMHETYMPTEKVDPQKWHGHRQFRMNINNTKLIH